MAPKAQKNINVNDSAVEAPQTQTATTANKPLFPYPDEIDRLKKYDYFERLFMGDHFGAFSISIDDTAYNKAYAKMRYVMANFAGLTSRIVADMVFGEKPVITVEDGDQEYVDGIINDNHLHRQNYESAISNSYFGDHVYKLRIGKRNPGDEENSIIIEKVTPKIYFPKVDPFNVVATPAEIELAWTFNKGDKKYLRKEIHKDNTIINEVYQMQENQIMNKENISILGPGILDRQETKIKRSLIVHIPNYRVGSRHFGISDYSDLDTLFYAVNNRISKIDNILDKHSDPILMVPTGILDEKGNVKKKALGVIEIQEGETGKPEYIVWDASLENAFKEIEKLVDMLLMMSDSDRALFGLDTGSGADSGRALKLKLLRTIAKAKRKILYFDPGLKEVLYVAQLLGKAHGVKVNGKLMKGEPKVPNIKWMDGIPEDEGEQIDKEAKRIDAGLTSKKHAIMRIDSVDEETAEKEIEEIDKETAIDMPDMNVNPDMKGNMPPNMPGNKGKQPAK